MKVELDGQIAGFALWYLPGTASHAESESSKKNLDLRSDPKDVERSGWNPPEGMNVEFFMQKITSFVDAKKRDYDRERDMSKLFSGIVRYIALCWEEAGTYDHRSRRIGHPVRSARHKP
jgi:hypothetical protein